jgi:hypothetical protein
MARRARRKFEFDWDAEARNYALGVEHHGELGVPLDEGTDQLILDFLEKGDPQPLIHFLKNDHEFGPRLRHYLALMLDDTYPSYPPFRLIIEKRANRRRRKHLFPRAASNQLRDNKAATGLTRRSFACGMAESKAHTARALSKSPKKWGLITIR